MFAALSRLPALGLTPRGHRRATPGRPSPPPAHRVSEVDTAFASVQLRAMVPDHDQRIALAVPIPGGDLLPHGLVYVEFPPGRVPADEDVELLRAMCAELGTALTHHRLLQKVREETEARPNLSRYLADQVVEAVPVSRRWWVLVRLPRAELVNSTRTQLNELDQRIADTMTRLQTQSIFEQFLNQRPVPAEIAEVQATLALLRVANPGFDGSSYAQRYLDYEDRLARVRRELAIRVDSDELAAVFSRRLGNLLADQGVRASMGSPVDGQSSIQVRSEVEDYDFGADMESKVTLRLTTRDERGNQLASVERNKVGASVTSKESARKQAQNMLVREAEKEGVLAYLGLTGNSR